MQAHSRTAIKWLILLIDHVLGYSNPGDTYLKHGATGYFAVVPWPPLPLVLDSVVPLAHILYIFCPGLGRGTMLVPMPLEEDRSGIQLCGVVSEESARLVQSQLTVYLKFLLAYRNLR